MSEGLRGGAGPQTRGMGWQELYEDALHGFVDLDDVRAAELTRDQARHRASTDGWDPNADGGWRLPTHPDSPRHRLVAAIRTAGPDAVADRHSALALRGVVSAFPSRPQVLLPHEARSRRSKTVDVRRTRRLLADHVDEVDGIPCAVAARAIADLAGDLRVSALRSLALAAERDGHMASGELARVLDALPRNWRGRGRLRTVVEDLGTDGSESGFEFTTRSRLGDTGLRPDAEQPIVSIRGRRRRIDVAWVALRVGIECQGPSHVGAAALDADAVRLNGLVAEGDWLVLQLTPTMLHDGWDAFLADLHQCLRRRAAHLGLPLPPGVPPA